MEEQGPMLHTVQTDQTSADESMEKILGCPRDGFVACLLALIYVD